MRSPTLILLASLVLAGLPGCATGSGRSHAPSTDPTLAASTFIEEGNLVALIVSSRSTRYRLDRPYIPLEVALVNRGLPTLTLTRESFTLAGPDGRRYPLAGVEELRKNYGGSLDLDRRFLEAAPIVVHRYGSYSHVPSNFSPGFRDPIVRERVFLPRFSYLLDFLYFPRPEGDLEGQALELQVQAPELPDPVYVRFEIAGAPG